MSTRILDKEGNVAMSQFKPGSKDKIEKLVKSSIHFVCEQDGDAERALKAKLSELFKREKNVKKAYLARVSYDASKEYPVALCLHRAGGPNEALVRGVSSVFSSLFGAHEHLDVIFLEGDQDTQLSAVCKPFFAQE